LSACLDAWAVVAWLDDDAGSDAVADALQRGRPCMSWINAGEVHYVISRAASPDAADRVLSQMRADVDLVEVTGTRVLAAAALKAGNRMSYADCFAVATAIERRVPLLTSDPEITGATIPGLEVIDIAGGGAARRRG
jgi:uncharacterized protein with PIN domain